MARWLILLMLITSSAHAELGDNDWRNAGYVLHFIDYLQTREIATSPKFYEANPLIGENPSITRVNTFFIIDALIHAGIQHTKYKQYWNVVFVGFKATAVAHNFRLGVRLKF